MKKTAILFILAISLFLPFLGGSAYAESASDVTYTFDSQHLGAIICNNDNVDLPNCSDYTYINVDVTDFSTYDFSRGMYISPNGQTRMYILADTTVTLVPSITRVYFDPGSGFTGSITVTLTNNSGCPEPEPCPECTDCNENLIGRLFKDIFWNLSTALVVIIVPALALFLLFRLVHDLLWGRG